ncbi:hypothetical protein GCM10008959_13240 [Deinococcus seoulensis]|uniref:Tyr recombinase domain-containing protein n=1 Tax=Deinococcus seoulensis TaxID=1837379 RepID=A0ABQ2RNS5_9DEIO|nr:hypothetical protein [Deinococcus seoulensis]GGR53126.1 hypothetical protein GCM10008959_13240 [Deinococcus seoulensis]
MTSMTTTAQPRPLPVHPGMTEQSSPLTAGQGWQYYLTLPRENGKPGTNAERSAVDLGNRLRAFKDAALGFAHTEDLNKVPLSFLARDVDTVLDDLILGTTRRLGHAPNAKMASNLRSSLRHLRTALSDLLKLPGVAPKAARQLRRIEQGRWQKGLRSDQWPAGLRAELEQMREAYTDPDYAGPGYKYLVTKTLRPISFDNFATSLNRLVAFLLHEKGYQELTLLDLIDPARFLQFRQWYFKQVKRGGHAFFQRVCTGLAKIAAYLKAIGSLETPFEVTSTHPETPWMQFVMIGRRKRQEGYAKKQYADAEKLPIRTPGELAALARKLRDLPPRTTDGRAPSRRQAFRRLFAAVFFGLGVYAPVRGRNWREMRWGDHLREEQPGEWWIEFSGADLKNGTYGDRVNTYRLRLPQGAIAWVLWWREQLRAFLGDHFEQVTPLVFPMLSTLQDDQGNYCWVQMSHKYFLECVDNAALEVLGQRFRPHMIRHCVATHIVGGGQIEDAQQAATLLGDTLSTVLRIYFRPDKQRALDEGYYAELDADQ